MLIFVFEIVNEINLGSILFFNFKKIIVVCGWFLVSMMLYCRGMFVICRMLGNFVFILLNLNY